MPASSHPSRANIQREVQELLPSLSRVQANVLGEMVYAMLMVDGCGMTRMCSSMAELLDQPMNTLRQKYRERYYEKEAKAGVKKRQRQRREVVVEEMFADLLPGVLRQWKGEKTLVLALDASALTDRFTVLSISVVYRGCGMRVAWTMLQGHQEGEWRPHWERMLKQLAEAVPAEWTVLVMADRGLYAAWLYQAIQANGWHPFLRVKKALSFRAQGEEAFGSLGGRVKRTGREWKGRGEWSEKAEPMRATVFVRWEQGDEEAICVVSDLSPEKTKTACSQMRFWMEDEYKDGKRGWFHWEHTKMTNPGRASRLWLVLAIVLHKAILLGGQLEAQEQEARQRRKRRQSDPKRRPGRPALQEGRPRGREQSVLLRGIMAMRAAESGGKKVLPQAQVRATSTGAGGQTSCSAGASAGEEKSPSKATKEPASPFHRATRHANRARREPDTPADPGWKAASPAKATRRSSPAAFAERPSPGIWEARATRIWMHQYSLEQNSPPDDASVYERGSSSSALPRTSPTSSQARAQGNWPTGGSWIRSTSGSMKKPTREKPE
jgi:hypothetical protein